MWLLDELEKLKESDCIAIQYREESITFRELWNKSESLSVFLKENNKNQNPLVIYGNKEIDIIIGMHAALKSGVPYVPVDTSYPVHRLLQIAQQVDCNFIINFSDLELEEKYQILNQESLNRIYVQYNSFCSNKRNWVNEDDICYILFTSGSTGTPKGVPISKANLINFSTWFEKYCFINKEKLIVMNQAAYSFDLSVIALYVFLPLGKTLLNVDKMMANDINSLFRYLKQNQLMVWISTPSFLEYCSFDNSFNSSLLNHLTLITLNGEMLKKDLVKSIFDKFKNIKLINGYGPTECTVAISACEITLNMLEDKKSLPIGKLLDDGVVLIDKDKEGENGIGELHIISKSVSSGYYKNAKLTQEKFYKSKNGNNGYKTGDLVFEEDGLLYFVARKDFQIKLNGFRIELNDIEANLNRIDYISNSVVLPIYKEDKIAFLAAFILPKGEVKESELKFGIKVKKDLGKLVPSYMVPKKVVVIEKFPLNVNGKIDRKKLLEEC